MFFQKKVKLVGQKRKQRKQLKSLKELKLKQRYDIIKAVKCKSQLIMLELENCKIYLPKRFTTELTCEDIEHLSQCSIELLEPMGKSFSIDFHIKEAKKTFLEKLNSIGQLKCKPFKSLKLLNLKERYDILKAEKCDSPFGEQIVLELEDCKVSLPKRCNLTFDREMIEYLPNCSMEVLEPYGWSFLIDFHDKKEITEGNNKEEIRLNSENSQEPEISSEDIKVNMSL